MRMMSAKDAQIVNTLVRVHGHVDKVCKSLLFTIWFMIVERFILRNLIFSKHSRHPFQTYVIYVLFHEFPKIKKTNHNFREIIDPISKHFQIARNIVWYMKLKSF